MIDTALLHRIFVSIEENSNLNEKTSDIYKLHKYWARKPWYIVKRFISKYSQQGDLVFDPFCGSGVTGLESILLNRDFVGQDINPIALLISKETSNIDFDLTQFLREFKALSNQVQCEINQLYNSDFSCDCGRQMIFKYTCSGSKFETELPARIYCPKCKKSERDIIVLREDFDLYQNSLINKSKYGVPENHFPKEFYKDRFSYKGISKVSEMYTNRNLLALSLIKKAILESNFEYHNLFLIAFSNTVLHSSKLKSLNIRPLGVNNYWIPDDYIEENVWMRFENRINNLIKGKKELSRRISEAGGLGQLEIKMKSALNENDLLEVDYVFTDPPYGDTIQYSELSFIWNSWLDTIYHQEDEVIINPKQNKGIKEFSSLLDKSLELIFRQLKPNGYFTLCFQNKDFDIWQNVLNTCNKLGFTLVNVDIFDVYGSPYNKNWSKFSPKSDIYVTFKKVVIPFTHEIRNYDEFSLENLIFQIVEIERKNQNHIDIARVYNITVAYVIWMIGKGAKISVKSFSTKSINNILQSLNLKVTSSNSFL